MFKNIFIKLISNKKKKNTPSNKNRTKKDIVYNNKESQLYIEHYLNYDRGGLFLLSYDIKQLKYLKNSLENRGIDCILFDNFIGGNTDCKFEIMNETNHKETFSNELEKFLKFCDKYFGYGRPIPNYDFFTEDEKLILEKWWK